MVPRAPTEPGPCDLASPRHGRARHGHPRRWTGKAWITGTSPVMTLKGSGESYSMSCASAGWRSGREPISGVLPRFGYLK